MTEIHVLDVAAGGRERLRQRFRPQQVRVLFVGESPPASGRFFYQQDSGLYRAMRDAFWNVDPSINDDNFLAVFRSSGCYLIDVCREPVDRLGRAARGAACRDGEAALSTSIAQMQPQIIIAMLKSIGANVRRAAADSHWTGKTIELSYPGRWKLHRERFMQGLIPLIRTFVAPAP